MSEGVHDCSHVELLGRVHGDGGHVVECGLEDNVGQPASSAGGSEPPPARVQCRESPAVHHCCAV